jgi:hypothetical protein
MDMSPSLLNSCNIQLDDCLISHGQRQLIHISQAVPLHHTQLPTNKVLPHFEGNKGSIHPLLGTSYPEIYERNDNAW